MGSETRSNNLAVSPSLIVSLHSPSGTDPKSLGRKSASVSLCPAVDMNY